MVTKLVFNTQNILPTLTTTNISFITSISASCGGTILNNGGATIMQAEFAGVHRQVLLLPTVKQLMEQYQDHLQVNKWINYSYYVLCRSYGN